MNAFEILKEDLVAAVVRAPSVADPAGLADALAGSGVRLVEFTLTIPNATEVIKRAGNGGAVVGAGTVMTARQAEEALDAGAQFLVSPTVRREVAEVGVAAGVPVFLGGFTPTEVAAAHDAGSMAVKVFPAGVGGPGYLRELRGPFPDVALVPSGGVSEANAREWLEAGATAVFAGSSIVPAGAVERGDHDEIVRRTTSFVARIGRS